MPKISFVVLPVVLGYLMNQRQWSTYSSLYYPVWGEPKFTDGLCLMSLADQRQSSHHGCKWLFLRWADMGLLGMRFLAGLMFCHFLADQCFAVFWRCWRLLGIGRIGGVFKVNRPSRPSLPSYIWYYWRFEGYSRIFLPVFCLTSVVLHSRKTVSLFCCHWLCESEPLIMQFWVCLTS